MKDGIPYGGIYPIDDAPTQGSNNAVKSGGVYSELNKGSVSVTADGVKDTGALFDELMALVDKYKLSSTSYVIFGNDCYRWQYTGSTLNIPFTQVYVEIDKLYVNTLRYTTGGSAWYQYTSTNGVQNRTSEVLPSGYPITLYY